MRAAVPAWRGSARRGDVGVRGYFSTSVPWPWGGPWGRVRGSSPFGLFSVTDLRALSCLRHLWTPEAPRVLPLVDLLLEVSPLFVLSSS